MKPKEKAEELVNNFLETIPFADTNVYEDWKKEMKNKAKECALIAVDELIITEFKTVNSLLKIISNNKIKLVISLNKDYWQEVKQEIEKI